MNDVFFRSPGSGAHLRAPPGKNRLASAAVALSFFLVGIGLRIRTLPPPQRERHVRTQTRTEAPLSPTVVPVKTTVPKPIRAVVRGGASEREIRKAFSSGDLDRAEELLGDGSGVPRDLASEVRYARCRRAFLRREWPTAIRACEQAEKLAPHPRARRLLVWCSERARRLFLEGYGMERIDPEGAVRKFREAFSCAPSKSSYRAKASAKLKGSVRSETLDAPR